MNIITQTLEQFLHHAGEEDRNLFLYQKDNRQHVYATDVFEAAVIEYLCENPPSPSPRAPERATIRLAHQHGNRQATLLRGPASTFLGIDLRKLAELYPDDHHIVSIVKNLQEKYGSQGAKN